MPTATQTPFASDRAQEVATELGVSAEQLAGVKPSSDNGYTVDDVRKAGGSGDASSSGWPSKGGKGKQPWEHGDTLVLAHGRPTLSSGSDGPAVADLATRLASLGYESSFSRGENHFGIVDESVLGAAQSFRRDYGVLEDPSGFPGGEPEAANHVGPWTWEALLRVTE